MKRNKSALIILLLVLISNYCYPQKFEWGGVCGGIIEDYGEQIKTDSFGNVYIFGLVQESPDMDPGSGVLTLSVQGSSDLFIQKLDSSGNLLWVYTVPSLNDGGFDIDQNGNVYITSGFTNSRDLDPGAGIQTFTSAGGSDVFILKLSPSGNFLWGRSFGSTGSETGRALTLDHLGHVYLAGSFTGTVDFDFGAGVDNLSTAGNFDIFVQKIDTSGNFIWAKSFGGTNVERALSIKADQESNVYTTGVFLGTIDLDPGVSSSLRTSNGLEDTFIQKLDSNGNYLWANTFGGILSDQIKSLTIDNSGNVYSTGEFHDSVDFDPGPMEEILFSGMGIDIFIHKTDQNGNLDWVQSFGSINGLRAAGSSIFTDKNNDVYISGNFDDTVDFDPGVNVYNLISSVPFTSSFYLKLDSLGHFQWARSMESQSSNSSNAIFVDDDLDIYSTGFFSGASVDLDLGPGISTFSGTNSNAEIFILKMGYCQQISVVDNRIACDSFTWIDGTTYFNNNNTAVYRIINSEGCDSVIYLNLIINNSSTSSEIIISCDTFFWSTNGQTYSNSGTYTALLTDSKGCDSLVTLNLTINNSNSIFETISACDSFYWSSNGATYYTSTNDTIVMLNSFGCDSTIILNLNINQSNSNIESITACDSFTWNTNGQTYFFSGLFSDTLINSAGCDSLAILDLTINNSNGSIEIINECNSYTWPNTGQTYTMSGLYFDTLTNASGCDSIITLDLEISQSDLINQVISDCDSFFWPVNGQLYTTSALDTVIFTNKNGCDSILILNLDLNNSDTASETISTCDSLIWLANGQTYTSGGTYTTTLTNIEGCDSIITLNLTIDFSQSINLSEEICQGDSFVLGSQTLTSSGTYTEIFSAQNGCDSLVNLNINVINIDTAISFVNDTLISNSNGTSFQWIDCDNGNLPIQGANSQSFAPGVNGNYAVVINLNNCSDTSECINVSMISLNGLRENTFSFYPNPASNRVVVKDAQIIRNSRFEIVDYKGFIVLKGRITASNTINVSGLKSGIYYLRIITNESIHISKLAIEN